MRKYTYIHTYIHIYIYIYIYGERERERERERESCKIWNSFELTDLNRYFRFGFAGFDLKSSFTNIDFQIKQKDFLDFYDGRNTLSCFFLLSRVSFRFDLA